MNDPLRPTVKKQKRSQASVTFGPQDLGCIREQPQTAGRPGVAVPRVSTTTAWIVVSNDEERKDQTDLASPDQAGFGHFDSFYKLNLELVQDLDDQR